MGRVCGGGVWGCCIERERPSSPERGRPKIRPRSPNPPTRPSPRVPSPYPSNFLQSVLNPLVVAVDQPFLLTFGLLGPSVRCSLPALLPRPRPVPSPPRLAPTPTSSSSVPPVSQLALHSSPGNKRVARYVPLGGRDGSYGRYCTKLGGGGGKPAEGVGPPPGHDNATACTRCAEW